ncbi:MAG: phage holin family protein [Verrucomicrobia bacterium]|nr:phage holin family protein [Verrucomicrobiota bacterium]
MKHPLLQKLVRWSVLALGIALSTKIIPGIRCDGPFTLFCVVVLLTFFNDILKPLLVFFTMPFIVLSLGIGLILINAGLFYLVSRIVQGFYVAGFWPALGGALVVGVTNMVVSQLLRGKRPPPGTPPSAGPRKQSGAGEVIDI